MSIAAKIRSDLVRLFSSHGRPLTIRRNAGAAYDPTTGISPASTDDTEFTGTGRVGTYSDYLVANEVVRRGDRKVTFIPDEDDYTAPAYVPKSGDVIVAGSDEYAVVLPAQTRELSGELICYTIQARNG